MTCKITARVMRVESLRGRVTLEEHITASVPRLAGPIVDGWYEGGVRQVRQFRTLINELHDLHQPEHFGFWPLDGSLEEDAGRLPLVHSNLVDFIQRGGREVAQFGGVGASAMWGTENDFRFLHETRVFTMGVWFQGSANSNLLIGTTDSAAQPGARIFHASNRPYFDVVTPAGYSRFTPNISTTRNHPSFYVVVGTGNELWFWADKELSSHSPFAVTHALSPVPNRLPLTIGLNAPDTLIWNAFATSQVLTDAEIYRLYVAGMQELMG